MNPAPFSGSRDNAHRNLSGVNFYRGPGPLP